jgi:SPP1 family predicted phage head-tail adaptor
MSRVRVNSGKYRHVVTFQKMGENKSSYGGNARNNNTNWMDAKQMRVGIFPISGKDIFEKEYVNSEITHKIHVRYDPTFVIDSSMRILFGSRIFDIISPPINYQEKNVELQLLCKERL